MALSPERKWELFIEQLDSLSPGEETLIIVDGRHVVVVRVATDEDIIAFGKQHKDKATPSDH